MADWPSPTRAIAFMCSGGALLLLLIAQRRLSPAPSSPLRRDNLLRCLGGLGHRHHARPPWLAVYGDSLGRGVFFDLLAALNGSNPKVPHRGHFANYSDECSLLEERPPTGRRKCGGFAYDVRLGKPAAQPPVRVAPLEPPSDAGARSEARLTFRLKTFGWEPAFDEPWLEQLRHAPRLPDVLLLSFGIWDMQYPPANSSREGGAVAFSAALGHFLETLGRSLDAARQRSGRRNRARPRVYWLTVTAVASERLPAWKRPRMDAATAARYNTLAAPQLAAAGIGVIDTYTSGKAHPELSLDGVHFPGPLSRKHAEMFLRQGACARPGASPG